MSINVNNILLFLLVLFRFTGMLVMNPIFGRRNIPVAVNAGLAFVLAVVVHGSVPDPGFAIPTLLGFLPLVLKELLVGFAAGFVLQLFMSLFIVGGEMIDMQLGLSMSKAFDPGSNASISLSAQFFNILFVLAFFLTNAHLTLIKMTAQSFQVMPIGSYLINTDGFSIIPQLFSNVLVLAVKLSLPLVVVEIIVTFAVGIIMRIIPQINVFVVNIQFKLFIGMLVLVLLVPSFTGFCENIIYICTDNIQTVWLHLIDVI